MKRGDVVLVQVPFVGFAGAKLRPALIIQCDALNGMLRETLIAAITSNLSNVHQPHQLLITADGAASSLLTDSAIRCERIHTVPQSDVKRTIGQLTPNMLTKINDYLKSALAIV